MKWLAVLVVPLALAACNGSSAPASIAMNDLVLLTRDGCANTTTMRGDVDVALRAMGLGADYQ